MSDTVEKIYCTDNNDALLASVMGKNNNDPMAMAAMLNNNQWMNNPFIYLVFLMMFGRNEKYNDARLELSQVRQNQYLISQLKPTTTTTTTTTA